MSKKTEFEKLKALWYQKLKDETDFVDIEQDEDNLKSWSSVFNREGTPRELIESKTAYYQMATDFLNDYEFENEKERLIWAYHADAVSVRDIAKILYEDKITTTRGKDAIWLIVQRLENNMKALYLILPLKKTNE